MHARDGLLRRLTARAKYAAVATDTETRRAPSEQLAALGAMVAGLAGEVNNPNHAILLSADLLTRVWRDLVPALREYGRMGGEFSAAGMNMDELVEKVSACIDGVGTAARRIDHVMCGLKGFATTARQRPGRARRRASSLVPSRSRRFSR